ncbi:putative aldouronate transport system permease protein [Paenibacillus sp. UNCCL117]|uniref:ABC transporter permease n=1 Tax=unclassified Paenibacillus TaxID=185978 RepID=UPI00088FF813|nr:MULTISPECIES: ABC transporter permease subunit [unclassified Paenibacillus]SDD03298.1 putative aldouronate transport system permease protein [Paenibacillus sp. cl123]SFW32337.1 putative aldouronate transport system permease protein [Paenibacillus sp. UNCCL117]
MQADAAKSTTSTDARWKPKHVLWKRMLVRYELYVMLLLPVAWYILFKYVPMYGITIAFKDFSATKGILGSSWVGLKHFDRFFSSVYFWELMWNTLSLSLFQLLVGFPIPILLALLVNEIRVRWLQKLLQNTTYIPHFLSIIVLVGMLNIFLHPETGKINQIMVMMGMDPIDFMKKADWFQTIFVTSGIWQHMGWGSIIYLAALSGIDPTLYEAAKIDGATRFRRVLHVSIPGIMPTVIILFILQIGQLMDVGFEKALLMQNPLNASKSDILPTFVYKNGIQGGQFSYTAAAGLFNAVIDFTLLVLVNGYARRKTESSLW